jgi:hypothetical protein
MPAGRPPIFETPEQLQDLIDEYFKEGVTVKKVVIGKAPNNYTLDVEVPTISGLTYYIGFESRQSFYDYEQKQEFSYTIKRARLFIEQHYEEMLQTGNTTGAIFALKNFDWKDTQEVNQKTTIKDDRIDDSKLTDEELRTLVEIQRKSSISQA